MAFDKNHTADSEKSGLDYRLGTTEGSKKLKSGSVFQTRSAHPWFFHNHDTRVKGPVYTW